MICGITTNISILAKKIKKNKMSSLGLKFQKILFLLFAPSSN
jgi:hypothetical protein